MHHHPLTSDEIKKSIKRSVTSPPQFEAIPRRIEHWGGVLHELESSVILLVLWGEPTPDTIHLGFLNPHWLLNDLRFQNGDLCLSLALCKASSDPLYFCDWCKSSLTRWLCSASTPPEMRAIFMIATVSTFHSMPSDLSGTITIDLCTLRCNYRCPESTSK